MKRLLLFLFALVITTSLWAYKVEIDSIYYKLDETNKTAQVTYGDFLDNEYSGTVIIPSSVYYNSETYIVTSIGDAAFSDCTSLISVNIPNSVTSISERAFYNCSSLISISFPNNVTSIGSSAFEYCI